MIIYHHHPCSSDDIAGVTEICKEYGSNSALMVEILKERGIMPTPEEATILAMGIFEDTGSLLFPSTRPGRRYGAGGPYPMGGRPEVSIAYAGT